ncbi:2149_t:CDS:2, partial [Cetraspora pellucida]
GIGTNQILSMQLVSVFFVYDHPEIIPYDVLHRLAINADIKTMKAETDLETISSTKPELSELIEGTVNVTNTLSPIIPILGVVTSLLNDIFTIHENAQFNKKMSRSIIN